MPVLQKQKKKQKRGAFRILLILIYIAVIVYIVVALMSGSAPGFAQLTGMFSNRASAVRAGEYNFSVGRDRVFADLGGSLAAAGTLGVQVLDHSGSETLRDSFRMSSPAIVSAGRRAIAFDISGTEVRVFDGAGVTAAFQADGTIISASINQNGWFAVVTQPGGGYRGLVTVYNDRGVNVFEVFTFERGFAVTAALSPDNRRLALLSLTEDGSRVWFFNLDSPDPVGDFLLPGGVIIDIAFLSGGNVLAVSTRSLLVIGVNGRGTEFFEFDGRHLRGHCFDGDFIALHLLDRTVGYSGRIVTLNEQGRVFGEMDTGREVISMSTGGGYLAVLWSDGVLFYDRELDEFLPYGDGAAHAGADARRVLALDGGAALVAGDFSAVVLNIDG